MYKDKRERRSCQIRNIKRKWPNLSVSTVTHLGECGTTKKMHLGLRGRGDGNRDESGTPYMNLPSPNVQNEENDQADAFRKLSAFEDRGAESDHEDIDAHGPPASALTRRRALVPPKLLSDAYESANEDTDSNEKPTSKSGSNESLASRKRRSSIVVIPPMQICPGDLLVYSSKVLTQRNNLLGDLDGSTQSLAVSDEAARKGKTSWSLLRLRVLAALSEELKCVLSKRRSNSEDSSNYETKLTTSNIGSCCSDCGDGDDDVIVGLNNNSNNNGSVISVRNGAAGRGNVAPLRLSCSSESTMQNLCNSPMPSNMAPSPAIHHNPNMLRPGNRTPQFDRPSRTKSESLFGLEEVLTTIPQSDFADEQLSKYKGMPWSDFLATIEEKVTSPEGNTISTTNSAMGNSDFSSTLNFGIGSGGSNNFLSSRSTNRSTSPIRSVTNSPEPPTSTSSPSRHEQAIQTMSRSDLKRQEAVWDLFQSECLFLYDHLMVLKNVFMEPLKKVQVEGFAMFAEPEVLFGNLDELCCVTYAFCKEFINLILQNINGGELQTMEVLVRLFQKSSKAMSLSQAYHRYALNYINALNYLETLRRQVEFNEFEKFFSRDSRCKKLQLTDLLVAPVQHIMKIPIILKDIESRTEDASEKAIIIEILASEENSLRELDDKMKWLKNFERLLEIQRNIIWPSVIDMDPKIILPESLKTALSKQPCERLIVSPRRQIIKEGGLQLFDAGKPTEMFVILFDDMLLITRKKKGLHKKKSSISENWSSSCGRGNPLCDGSATRYIVYRQPLSLDRFYIHDVSLQEAALCKLENAFVLVVANRFQQLIAVYVFQSPTDQEKTIWLQKLRETQERNHMEGQWFTQAEDKSKRPGAYTPRNRRSAVSRQSRQSNGPEQMTTEDIYIHFIENTQIPWIYYISTRQKMWKVMWLIIIVGGIAVAFVQSQKALQGRKCRYDVSLQTTFKLNSTLPFPAVTICTNSPINWRQEEASNSSIYQEVNSRRNDDNERKKYDSKFKRKGKPYEEYVLFDVLKKYPLPTPTYGAAKSVYWEGKRYFANGTVANTFKDLQDRKIIKLMHDLYYGDCLTFNAGVDNEEQFQSSALNGIQFEVEWDGKERYPELNDPAIVLVVHPAGVAPTFGDGNNFKVYPKDEVTVGVKEKEIERLSSPYPSHCVPSERYPLRANSVYYGDDRKFLYSIDACINTCIQRLSLDICSCFDYQIPIGLLQNDTKYQSFSICASRCSKIDSALNIDRCKCHLPCREIMLDLSYSVISNLVTVSVPSLKLVSNIM
ncbi:hypothetical protein CHUAL_005360 [Chamberlinius hualienensis]